MNTIELTETERLHFVLETLHVAYWEWHIKEKTAHFNATIQSFFNVPETLSDFPNAWLNAGFVHPDDFLKYRTLLTQIQEGAKESADDLRLSNGQSGFLWYHIVYKVSVTDEMGLPTTAIATATNINQTMLYTKKYESLEHQYHALDPKTFLNLIVNISTDQVLSFLSTDLFQSFSRYTKASVLFKEMKHTLQNSPQNERMLSLDIVEKLNTLHQTGRDTYSTIATISMNEQLMTLRIKSTLATHPETHQVTAFIAFQDVTDGFYAKKLKAHLIQETNTFISWLDLTHNQAHLKFSTDPHFMHLDLPAFYHKIKPYFGKSDPHASLTEVNFAIKFTEILEKSPNYSHYIHCQSNDCENVYQLMLFYLDRENAIVGCLCNDVSTLYHEEQKKKLALEFALKEATSANQSKTKFLSAMSHDLRTPMNAILGLLNLLLDEDLKPKTKLDLSLIKQSSEHILKILNEVLDISHIESGNVKINNIPFDLHQELLLFKSRIQNLADKKYIDLNLRVDLKHTLFVSDKLRLHRVLDHLVSNALQFSEKGTSIMLTCKERADLVDPDLSWIEIEVIDQGLGMTKEECKFIFDSFYRAGSSIVSDQDGSGLGLSITKGIIDSLNGKIEVSSVLGKGSTFKVSLPMPFLSSDTLSKKSSHRTHANKALLNGKKVLIAEDNDVNAFILKRQLEKLNIDVLRASDGLEACKLHNRFGSNLDCILMDIQMPILNGIEATKSIRQVDPNIPIIAVSANTFADDVTRSILAGMNTHISKPIDMDALIELLIQYTVS